MSALASTRGRPLFGAALAAASLLLIAGCGSSDAGTQPEAQASQTALGPDRWMEDVYADKPDTTLGQMVLPGTHDSASAGINTQTPCPLTTSASTSKAIEALGKANPCAAANMYRAQDTNLTAQLDAGIRYLDLRVAVAAPTAGSTAAPGPDSFVMVHEFVAEPLTAALDQLLPWAASHPKEQVILDFQHIDVPKDADPAPYYAALAATLDSYAPGGAQSVCSRAWSSDVVNATPETLANKVTLGQAWQAQRNLVVLVPSDTLPTQPCYYPRTNAILSQWPNTEDPATSTSYNANELAERQQRLAAQPQQCSNGSADPGQGDNWCGFFVNQMQLTFQPTTFAKCIADTTDKCSLEYYASQVNNTVGPQVQTWRIGQNLPVNIVIVDFFDRSDPSYTNTLIDVNRQLAAGTSATPAGSPSASG